MNGVTMVMECGYALIAKIMVVTDERNNATSRLIVGFFYLARDSNFLGESG